MILGLQNAAQTFQKFMQHTVLEGMEFIFSYIDDVIVASESEEQHRERLLFERLNRYGLTINERTKTFRYSKLLPEARSTCGKNSGDFV